MDMDRKKKLDELQGEIEQLREYYEQLGLKLIELGEGLRSAGARPDQAVLQEAMAAARKLDLLARKFKEAAGTGELSGTGTGTDAGCGWGWGWEADSLQELEMLCGELAGQLYAQEAQEEHEADEREAQETQEAREVDAWDEQETREVDAREAQEVDVHEAQEGREIGYLQPEPPAYYRGEPYSPPAAALQDRGGAEGGEGPDKGPGGEERVEGADEGSGEVPGEEFRVRLHRHILGFLGEARLDPAYWLACYGERKFGKAPVPSHLILAADLAAIVEGDGGPAAEWLAHLYGQPHFYSLLEQEPPGERREALSLVLFASLLRPALVAPGSGATALMIRIKGLPGKLGEITARVADAGQASGWMEKKLDTLSYQAACWLERNQKLTLASPPAVKLWNRMLEQGGLVERLLHPVAEKKTGALGEVKSLLKALQGEENLKKEVAMQYSAMKLMPEKTDIFHIPGSWQLLSRLQEALKIAERWAKVVGEAAQRTPLLPAEQLQEYLEMAAAGIQETERRHSGSELVASCAALCRHALEALKGGPGVEDRDLAPEELAALECGKNIHLKKKPPWQPSESAVERVGKALLELFDHTATATDDSSAAGTDVPESGEGGPDDEAAPSKKGPRLTGPAEDLDSIWENNLLTQQEKDFIKDTLRNIDYDSDDDSDDNMEEM